MTRGKIAEAREALRLADSYTRAECLLRLLRVDRSADVWRTVGAEWSVCDNIARWRRDFDIHFRRYRDFRGFPIAESMTPEARAVFDALPSAVTVYRGCYAFNVHGLSWTLHRATAERFPTLNRYWHLDHEPLMVTGSVRRANIAFVTVARNEAEIIAPWRSVHVARIEPLGEALRRRPARESA